jgi:hypothetical protein
MRSVLRIGGLSGVVAGATIGAFLATAGRGPIDAALALEEAGETHSAAHDEMFSRGVQQIGGLVGLLLYGTALGVVFAIVFAATARHLPARTALTKALQLGAVGFVTIALVPFLKYPANPPAVGDPDTINQRTSQYLVAVAASILLTVLVFMIAGRSRTGPIARAWVLTATYVAGVIAILVFLPGTPDRVDIAADLVWEFRLASIGGLAAGWAMLSLTAGTLFAVETHAQTIEAPAHPDLPGYSKAAR